MLTKRIIPCLDVKEGRTVKGVNFKSLRDAGDPIELAKRYCQEGADELVFLDISATHQNQNTAAELAARVSREIMIPFTVGGGITTVRQAGEILQGGADKVTVNSAAVRNPGLINELTKAFGSQAIVVAIDAEFSEENWNVTISGGRISTERELFEWVRETEDRGAGEILFTSMNHDGTKNGYAISALQQVCETISIPVIASGGAGSMVDFADVFIQTHCTGALAASVFHFGEISIPELKQYLQTKEIPIRL